MKKVSSYMNVHEQINSEFHMISLMTRVIYPFSCYAHVCMHACILSCARLFVTPWTVVHQAPLPMEFLWQGYWSGLPFPPPRDLPNPGMKPVSCISCIGRRILYHCATWENFQVGVWNLKLIIWILLQISDSNINVLFNLCVFLQWLFTLANELD